MSSAKAVEQTSNRKVGAVSVTMAAQTSCPSTCAFYRSGCYAESGPQGICTARLNKAGAGATPETVAQDEAAAIRGLSGRLPLRLHVVGDCATEAAARIVAEAAADHTAKAGQIVWTYTHAWRTVPRAAWGAVSVLASCETAADVAEAHARGYAAAIVTPATGQAKAWRTPQGDTMVPCPQQTGRAADCAACRLCWRDGANLAARRVVVFEAHGSGRRKAEAALAARAGEAPHQRKSAVLPC